MFFILTTVTQMLTVPTLVGKNDIILHFRLSARVSFDMDGF